MHTRYSLVLVQLKGAESSRNVGADLEGVRWHDVRQWTQILIDHMPCSLASGCRDTV